MDIKETEHGELVALALTGSIDTRSSFEFEKKVLERLAADSKFFIIDFSEVEQLTSSGIRVLLMLAQKLSSNEGGLALCSLSDHVQTVLEISGLADHFAIDPTRQAAIDRLRAHQGAPTGNVSKISSLAMRLLGGRARASGRPSPKAGSGSRLSRRVAEILSVERHDDETTPEGDSKGGS